MEKYEKAAAWFERRMPPMPVAREMYRTAVVALRELPRLRAERDALLERLKACRRCEDCAHYGEFEHCNEEFCHDCPRDCYCKDCSGGSKWEFGVQEGKANGQ